MDNLKTILKVLQKYQFWVICGIVLLVALVCWWCATSGLASQFRKRKSTLDSAFKGVVVAPNHPNQGMIDKIHQLHNDLKRRVYGAWEVLYSEQKQKNRFPKDLGEDFKQQYESLINKPKKELEPVYRELYQSFIARHFPWLLELGDIHRPADKQEPAAPGNARKDNEGAAGRNQKPAGGPGGMPGAAAGRGDVAEEDWIGTVDWNATDIAALESRFNWKETPSTLAVVLAQEDLWVVEALLRAIASTNEGTTYATAAVKQIQTLQIGRDAVAGQQEGSIIRATQSGGGPGGMPGMPPAGRPGMEGPGGPAMGPGGGGDDQRLIEGRYVDEKDKPLQYTPEYPYAKHPFAEFKMMPIRMKLVMDQRKLPRLLVECANSNMPIEVKRVRILKSQGGTMDLGPAGGMAGPAMGGPRGGGFRGPAAMPGEGAGRPARNATDKQDGGTFDVPVEIYGVIYIYNPPDRDKLGTGAASAEKPADGAPPGPLGPPGGPQAAPPATKKVEP